MSNECRCATQLSTGACTSIVSRKSNLGFRFSDFPETHRHNSYHDLLDCVFGNASICYTKRATEGSGTVEMIPSHLDGLFEDSWFWFVPEHAHVLSSLIRQPNILYVRSSRFVMEANIATFSTDGQDPELIFSQQMKPPNQLPLSHCHNMIEQLCHCKQFHVDMRASQPQLPNQKPIVIRSSRTKKNKHSGRGKRSTGSDLSLENHHASRRGGHKRTLPTCTSDKMTNKLLADNLPDIQIEVAPPILDPTDDFGWADFPLLSPILLDESFLPFDDSPEASVVQEEE